MLLVLGACSATTTDASDAPGAPPEGVAEDVTGSEGTPSPEPKGRQNDKPKRIDPRTNGFEITLGEWAVTPEATALRPGPVTFVVRNRGTMAHGFEIELEGESSGSGSGDLFKAEGGLLEPGETARLRVDLSPGVHKIECIVEGHDDLGMEGPLEVREDAPFIKEKAEAPEGQIAISEFAFDPELVSVPVKTEVEWRNDDPSAHTVTGLDDDFDSGNLDSGESFSYTFERPGTYPYRCNIHPDMEGTVKVE